MSTSWTRQAIEGLAPDTSSLKSALGLAKANQWQLLACSEQTLWGEIRGSGKDPYQARIDLSEPAFKCSCPSRKFPCKHGLALMLMYSENAATFTPTTPPAWVADWLSSREQRAEKKAAKVQNAAPQDPAAQAKRMQAREAKVMQGLDELERWLQDVMRMGLTKAQQQTQLSSNIVARLIDAQASGLAHAVEHLEEICASGVGWEARALDSVGRLMLMVQAYRQQAHLSPALREEVRSAIGWTQSQDDVLKNTPVQDDWCVMGHMTEHDAKVTSRRTWLWGQHTNQPALLLSFAAGLQPLPVVLPAGRHFAGDLCFFPGASGLRALIANQTESKPYSTFPHTQSVAQTLQTYADQLAHVPWTARWPMCLGMMRLVLHENQATHVVDAHNAALPLLRTFAHTWHWLAITGGTPADVFGEWDGYSFTPLTIVYQEQVYELINNDQPQVVPMTAQLQHA